MFAVSSPAFSQSNSVAAPAGTAKESLTPEVKDSVLAGVSRVIKNSAFVPGVDLTKWDEFITSEKDAIDKAKDDAEFAMAVRNAISKFGISHMVLMTPAATKARIERKAVGIGISIQPDDKGLMITTVYDGSPAAENGLQPGDILIEADGKKLTKDSTISGDEGTIVNIKVLHPNGKEQAYKITRRKFSNIRPDTIKWVNESTALVKINTFDLSYDRKKVDTLMAEAAKSKGLILDLRSNGGGAVINMLHLLGYLLPEDEKFGIFIGRAIVNRYVKETSGSASDLKKIALWSDSGWLRASAPSTGAYKGNLVVLINGGSGSASEISAQALKELRSANIVGSKSAGAVLVSTMSPLSNGWQLQYPISDYLSAQGIRLEGNGILPDVEAPTPRFGEADTAVEKALALLRRAELRNERPNPLLSYILTF